MNRNLSSTKTRITGPLRYVLKSDVLLVGNNIFICFLSVVISIVHIIIFMNQNEYIEQAHK